MCSKLSYSFSPISTHRELAHWAKVGKMTACKLQGRGGCWFVACWWLFVVCCGCCACCCGCCLLLLLLFSFFCSPGPLECLVQSTFQLDFHEKQPPHIRMPQSKSHLGCFSIQFPFVGTICYILGWWPNFDSIVLGVYSVLSGIFSCPATPKSQVDAYAAARGSGYWLCCPQYGSVAWRH